MLNTDGARLKHLFRGTKTLGGNHAVFEVPTLSCFCHQLKKFRIIKMICRHRVQKVIAVASSLPSSINHKELKRLTKLETQTGFVELWRVISSKSKQSLKGIFFKAWV